MPDPNNPIALLMGAIVTIGPIVGLLFKMLIAEKDERIDYLEKENLFLRSIAGPAVHQAGEALTVAKQRGTV